MDRDLAQKLNTTLTSIKSALESIKESVATIATNTTPADDSTPASDET